jgi:hypothetical protein
MESNGSFDKTTYLISDFQRNISALESLPDTSMALQILPLITSRMSNVSIQSVRLEAPVPLLNVENKLIISFTNHGRDEESVQFSMEYENQNRPLGTLSIEPGESIEDTVSILINRPGQHNFIFRIDDYPVTFDDNWMTCQILILESFPRSLRMWRMGATYSSSLVRHLTLSRITTC